MIKRKTFCIRKRPTWSLKRAFTLYTGHRFGTWVDRRLNRALVHFIAGARTVFKKTTSTLTCLWSPWKYCCLHLEFERTLNILLHTKQRSCHSILRGKSWSDNCPADRLWQSCFSPGIDRFSTWRTGNCRLYNNQHNCTVALMSYLVNMSSDVMWYASQSGHAIYRGSRGIGLEKNLRCSLVFEQNLQV